MPDHDERTRVIKMACSFLRSKPPMPFQAAGVLLNACDAGERAKLRRVLDDMDGCDTAAETAARLREEEQRRQVAADLAQHIACGGQVH
jgi:hypothetical protein